MNPTLEKPQYLDLTFSIFRLIFQEATHMQFEIDLVFLLSNLNLATPVFTDSLTQIKIQPM